MEKYKSLENFAIYLNDDLLENYIIDELELNSKYNQQNLLLLLFILPLEEFKKIENKIFSENIDIKIMNKDKNIFLGNITSFETYESNTKIYIRVEAKDKSIKLNMKNKFYRLYQDTKIKYSTIIEDVLKGKNLEYHISSSFNKEIGNMIFQYEENDWAFLKRICSYLNIPIFITKEGIILFGYDNISIKRDIV